MLELRSVSAGYGRTNVLHAVNLTVREGEIVSLVGANGAGKSTLAKTVSGLVPIRSGTITFGGRALAAMSPRARILAGLAHVPEGRQVFSSLTVEENLLLGAHACRVERNTDPRERLREVCRSFPVLLNRLSSPAGHLSGGQQQMLAIARGLMSAPKLLLLDEPSLGLSPALVDEVFRLIATLRASGVSIFLSEQNARQSLAISDRGYVIETGRVVLEGRASDLLADPQVAEKYLGARSDAAGQTREAAGMLEKRLAAILGG